MPIGLKTGGLAMRVLSTIFVGAIVGILAGAALAYIEVRSDPDAADKFAGLVGTAPGSEKDEKTPRVQVNETKYNFGTMQRGTSKSHDFEFRNVGTAPLVLREGSRTCKCTSFDVPTKPIAPGGKATVKLEWSAKSDNGPFSQSASVLTTDPRQSEVALTIEGQILALSNVEPREFAFEKLAVDEVKTVHVYVMAMLQDELTISDPQFSDPTVRDKFDVKIEPVDRSVLPNKLARRGYRISMTSKPGLPIGRINSWLTIHTNLPDAEELAIPVIGQVVGDIGVTGLGAWREEENVLLIGSVKSSTGGHGKVDLIVRGSNAAAVQFSVKSKDPDVLKVTLGKPVKLKETLVHVPVDIEIPAGTRPMVHLDTVQGEAARIIFTTTHPKIKELSLAVRFAVER
jgi:hypothetical protein